MKNDAAGFVGNIPQYYDRGLGPVIFVDYAADIARRTAAAKPSRVLETAAGTGIVTRALRDTLPAETSLVATDLNQPMLDIARFKFSDGEPVTFQAVDATSLPFPDASFDAIVCQFGVMFFPDKPKSYAEALRVLAPGGRYIFSVWDSHAHNAFGRIGYELAKRFFPQDPPQFYNVPFSCHQIDPIKEALGQAGFRGIDIAVLRFDKSIPAIAPFAHAMVYGNPIIDQIRARGGVDPDEMVAAAAEALHGLYGPDPMRMPIQAIVYTATKG
jgi:ubiquinone/menaquinone biosynthesis C-methylase UbiE